RSSGGSPTTRQFPRSVCRRGHPRIRHRRTRTRCPRTWSTGSSPRASAAFFDSSPEPQGGSDMHTRLSAKEKRYLDRARVCRVASAEGSGAPPVAPLCHAFDAARRTVYMAPERRPDRNLRQVTSAVRGGGASCEYCG